MKFIISVALILFVLTPSQASVNMRNGSFTDTWVDYIDPDPGYELKIERFYSSRSLFIGLFGFGWCSNLETNLKVTSDGIVTLTECGGGIEVTYYPENFDLRSSQKTIDKIVKAISKDKKLTANEVKNLRTQLAGNTKMRFEHANRLHLVDTKKLKTIKNTFVAKSKGLEKIYFDGKTYKRKKYDGSVEKFDKKGRLIQKTNAYGLWIKLNYKGQNLAYITDQKGRRLNFSYNSGSQLKRISNGRGLEVNYTFQAENLVEVKNMWKKTYQFSYDKNHNLVGVAFPDKTRIKMAYDTTNDWIKTYINRKNCREDFAFLLSKSDPKNHYWGTYTRKCPNDKSVSGRHEFWYKNYSFSKDKYLHRVKEIKAQDFKDIYFHPYLGRAISVRENNTYNGYAYYLNGLINKREFKKYSTQREILYWSKDTYKYNLNKYLMTEAHQTRLNKLGKITGKTKTVFDYNQKGLLRKARQKRGFFVALDHHSSGKVSSLTNHKKESNQLSYKVGIDKPIKISHNRLGAINISYDDQGEVSSVESVGSRNIASSVVQSFLEMIGFLGPMGENLEI